MKYVEKKFLKKLPSGEALAENERKPRRWCVKKCQRNNSTTKAPTARRKYRHEAGNASPAMLSSGGNLPAGEGLWLLSVLWNDLLCSVVCSLCFGGVCGYSDGTKSMRHTKLSVFNCGCRTLASFICVLLTAHSQISLKQQPRWRGSSVEIPSFALMNWTLSSPTLTLVLALAHAVSTKKERR